ncbi:MAG: hypothetical protein QOC64_3632 [Solirubrobacteraceae bacterium]|nr:hypothetical protein [Solirubrobacteraceae bacterium]
MPAAHEHALPTPCRKRAASSITMSSANAKARLDTPISAMPTTTVGRTPKRAVSHPAGSEPRSVPAA